MKKFTINCDFNGQVAPFTIFIGNPEKNHHPLHFQADWLSKERGGTIPPEVMDSIGRLKELADKNNISLEELCVYALGAAQQEADAAAAVPEQASEEYVEDDSSEGEEVMLTDDGEALDTPEEENTPEGDDGDQK